MFGWIENKVRKEMWKNKEENVVWLEKRREGNLPRPRFSIQTNKIYFLQNEQKIWGFGILKSKDLFAISPSTWPFFYNKDIIINLNKLFFSSFCFSILSIFFIFLLFHLLNHINHNNICSNIIVFLKKNQNLLKI